jgi:hypothetical protein
MSKRERSQTNHRCQQWEWFLAAAYWLLPVSLDAVLPELEDKLSKLKTTPNSKIPHSLSLSAPAKTASTSEAAVLTAELKNQFQAFRASFQRFYNSQPVWHLRDLPIDSEKEARCAGDEFLAKVKQTSAEFCWPSNDPDSDCQWRIHGWKHISYPDMEGFWKDHSSGFEPATSRAFALGGGNEIRELFLAAANHDAEAVGIIWAQFPRAEDHTEIIEDFFLSNEKPGVIPHPSGVASELVDLIFGRPDSEEADRARCELLRLVSLSVRRGSRSRRGRPKSRIPPDSLRLLWKMGYCLVRQVREFNNFLSIYKELERDRLKIILGAYPWINKVSPHFADFLSLHSSEASLKLVSSLTGLSSSSLEKMGLRSGS